MVLEEKKQIENPSRVVTDFFLFTVFVWDLHESYLKISVHERTSLIFRGGVLSGMILQVPEKVGPYYIVINGVRKTPYKWPEINTLPETNTAPENRPSQ